MKRALLTVALLWLTCTRIAFSTNEFNLNQKIDYIISPTGQASVTHQLSLTNNYSEIYAKEYKLTLNGIEPINLSANDNQGNILVSSARQQDETVINLKFNQPSIGKDKTTDFSIRYTINDFAVNKGKTWEFSIPILTSLTDNNQTDLTINAPKSFGQIAFSSLPPTTINQLPNLTQINFSSLKNQKVLIILGNYQLFDFNLSYYLKNTSSQPVDTQIALPPDTNSQTIIFNQISPLPTNITVDTDGNWLAQYHLLPNQQITVLVTGQVKITPNININSSVDTSLLTRPQQFWPSDDLKIKSITSSLSNPLSIYNYVVNTLDYDYNRLNNATRKGALLALSSPSNSLCTEFTDLFVTLARAKGIPSREIEGFAYTNDPKIKPTNPNTDILHAWPQFYNISRSQWQSIDPTWAKTTKGINYFDDLDLNHFVFVIHGVSSQYPLPPGSYKKDSLSKTVTVTFANREIDQSTDNLQLSFSGIQLTIKNPNNYAIKQAILSSSQLNWSKNIDILLPFSTITIDIPPVSFVKSLLPKYQKLNINADYNNQNTVISVNYLPHFFNLAIAIFTIIVLLCLGGIILTKGLSSHHEKIT